MNGLTSDSEPARTVSEGLFCTRLKTNSFPQSIYCANDKLSENLLIEQVLTQTRNIDFDSEYTYNLFTLNYEGRSKSNEIV